MRTPSFSIILLLFFLCIIHFTLPSAAFFGRGGGGNAWKNKEEEEEVDYYAVLGLEEDATEKEVRQKFRELSRKYHPDVSNTEEARSTYAKINRANEVLSDKKKRRMYDMRGEEGLKQLERLNAQGDMGQATDPFSRLFGFSSGGGGGLRGPNSEGKLHVSLETIYTGGRESFTINKQRVCHACKGTGASRGSGTVACPSCGGRGAVLQRLQLAPGMFQEVRQACPACGGRGRVARVKCGGCGGARVHRRDVTLAIDIERGVPEGHTVTFEMEADETPDSVPGDLVMAIHASPHPIFARRGNGLDLDAVMTVTLRDALLGFTRTLRHLDGEEVKVQATGVTPFGSVIKIPGRGMPRHHMPSEKGDLYVKILFELPKMLTEAQRKEIEEHF